jgi:hypothetical protein
MFPAKSRATAVTEMKLPTVALDGMVTFVWNGGAVRVATSTPFAETVTASRARLSEAGVLTTSV